MRSTFLSVTVSTLEVYNEEIFDLLNVKERGLPIRQDERENVHVQGLSDVCVQCVSE